jgi:polar amino acid transport system substrate-binding protein
MVIVYTDWFPYTYEENGRAQGFEIDTLKAVLGEMNLRGEFVSYPWKRCLASLKNGEADALVSLLKTPEREDYTYYPDEYISISKTVFVTTAKKDVPFDGSLESLKNYTIGVISGFSYGEAFDNAKYLKKDESVDTKTLLTKLLNGRTDIAAENQAVLLASALKMGVKDRIQFLRPPIHTNKLYVGFSKAKGYRNLSDAFSRTLGVFKKTDAYPSILAQYGIHFSDMVDVYAQIHPEEAH